MYKESESFPYKTNAPSLSVSPTTTTTTQPPPPQPNHHNNPPPQHAGRVRERDKVLSSRKDSRRKELKKNRTSESAAIPK
ncbi:hypothetical protein CEXT_782501 [Caerostris extrusa]|uniref:Uncharacterized protein n=1 Tax=Caerostris extrusa TaxID=172846 RepID=A0AAV4MGH4_CAEEX|nr:hypothetical protein CEXT_782501 [Caerostris extrusa]